MIWTKTDEAIASSASVVATAMGLSNDIQCHVLPYFSKFANHQIKHQATHKVGCQPGDCIWSLESSSGVCVGIYGLTYSLYHP